MAVFTNDITCLGEKKRGRITLSSPKNIRVFKGLGGLPLLPLLILSDGIACILRTLDSLYSTYEGNGLTTAWYMIEKHLPYIYSSISSPIGLVFAHYAHYAEVSEFSTYGVPVSSGL